MKKLDTKKANMLPEEVLKIIMAVLGIVLLLYLAISLYGIFTNKNQLEQARATLDALVGKAETLSSGENTSVLITSPKNWVVYSFSKSQLSPNECKNSNCLCICPEFSSDKNEIIKSCDKSGACKVSSMSIAIISNSGVIKFATLPKAVIIQNNSGKISIFSASLTAGQDLLNSLVSTEATKTILLNIAGNPYDSATIQLLKNTIDSRLAGKLWTFRIMKNSVEVFSLNSDGVDVATPLSSMFGYNLKKASFNQGNNVYEIQLGEIKDE